ncbi:Cna protein B-type domain protein [Streptomyces sp. YIM 130001]|uniref:SpaA isopeptide-forming pilin-related protein n=1 Tax=Streptomyces sp. YIM 130001 TaxID=2259644 RepID=UPI000EDBC587|nr:SpaA isopeptide-forming pilin-related protein [Streptomyces sp. YIM 130001]RII17739.1 Cna protein B-type domain protein [Streptomyces sp. YIM 130001]
MDFPDATTAELKGTGQFQGSVLLGEQSSMTTVSLPGINGRFFTTGSMTHASAASGGGGQEFHNYPFNGDLPECGNAPQGQGVVQVDKKDADTGDPLPGARFELWRETNGADGLQTGGSAPDSRVGDTCTTDGDGVCAEDVSPGSYYWRETAAPDGYDLPDPAVFGPLVITSEDPQAGARITAENRPVRVPNDLTGSLDLLKKDARTGKPLGGAVFELWRETNGTEGLQTGGADPDTRTRQGRATDASGKSSFADLPLGEYYLRETEVPEGYVLPDNPVTGPYAVTAENSADGVPVTLKNKRGGPDKGK